MVRNHRLAVGVLAAFVGGVVPAGAMAEFELNWTADTANPTFNGTSVVHGTNTITGQTPFIYERVTDNGVNYYHLVVGNEASGFAQETYIQVGAQSVTLGFGQIGPQQSSSGGAILPSGNATDPLNNGAFGGNATGNPNRVQMRQIVEDGDLSMEFIKDRFTEKPSITNTIETPEIQTRFEMNSTGNTYAAPTPSEVSNTVEHFDPDVPADSVFFDAAQDGQNVHVTAGQYTHPTNPLPGGPGGAYTYVEGGANVNPDWSNFFDHRETNPWSYPDNRPTPPLP